MNRGIQVGNSASTDDAFLFPRICAERRLAQSNNENNWFLNPLLALKHGEC